MADEADQADGYIERMVEESLYVLRNRPIEVDAVCTFCEEFPVMVLPNGVRSMLCTRCMAEREEEIKAVVLPVSIVHPQGDSPEDSWAPTQIPSRKYRKKWWRNCPI